MKSIMVPLIALVLSASPAFSTTLYVPDNFPTIQTAIDAAGNGDTVIVRPGTYVENIDFKGKAITVESEQGPQGTILDGNQNGSVVCFQSGEGLDSILSGFSITNGSGTPVPPNSELMGGGVFCFQSSPTIEKNKIFKNSVYGTGGGVACEQNACPRISNNEIYENWILNIPHGGSGIFCSNGSDAIITNNSITENIADWEACGGGIECFYSAPLIEYNIIADNHGKSGGGIYSWYCDFTLKGNMIKANEADSSGGGIWGSNSTILIEDNIIVENVADSAAGITCGSPNTLTIMNNIIAKNEAFSTEGGMSIHADKVIVENCTIVENIAKGTYGGGGLRCAGNPVEIKNTILWNNQALIAPEIKVGWVSHPSTLMISYSVVKGGQASVYKYTGSKIIWGPGMIDADPLFMDPANEDYHLSWISPCINRGSNLGAPLVDIEGDPRPNMGTTDIGADEFTGIHPLESDVFTLSEQKGGQVKFTLDAGFNNNGRTYILLGSVTGNAPGTPLPGGQVTLPINWDLFTNIVIGLINTPICKNFTGALSKSGTTYATFDTLGPLPAGTAGMTLSFGYAVHNPWDFASNPINVEIVQ